MAAVDDFLTCAICLDWFKSPRRLPCQHVYCLECLRGLVKPETDYITCPECRRDHVMHNMKVDEFQIDGRLEQFVEKQRKLKPDSEENKLDSVLIRCDHSQPVCRPCQTIYKATMLELFLNESRQFNDNFLTEAEKMKRQTQKSELLSQKTHLEALRTRVVKEIKDMISELEKRQLMLLSEIEAQEKLCSENLSKLEQADAICAQYSALMAGFVDVLQTKTNCSKKEIVSLVKLLSEQNDLMTSLFVSRDKGMINVDFNREKIMAMIATYGQVYTEIDYKKNFTLMTTLDGMESGVRLECPLGLTVCPVTDNVYVTESTCICVHSNDGLYKYRITNHRPTGLAIDSNQRLIETRCTDNNVAIYNYKQELITSFGCCGYEDGQLNSPLGVACDSNNNIYVVDMFNKRIQVFTPDGTFLSVIGRGILELPCCVQINKRQEILVTDYQLGQVLVFSRDGVLLKRITGDGNKMEPHGICLDQWGRILVTDQKNKEIQVFNDDGTRHCTISEPAAAMTSMFGLAVTKSGTIFITDSGVEKIHIIK